jgi:hypothetical protein
MECDKLQFWGGCMVVCEIFCTCEVQRVWRVLGMQYPEIYRCFEREAQNWECANTNMAQQRPRSARHASSHINRHALLLPSPTRLPQAPCYRVAHLPHTRVQRALACEPPNPKSTPNQSWDRRAYQPHDTGPPAATSSHAPIISTLPRHPPLVQAAASAVPTTTLHIAVVPSKPHPHKEMFEEIHPSPRARAVAGLFLDMARLSPPQQHTSLP